MVDVVHELLFTEVAIEKLGRRGISRGEARQIRSGFHVVLRNSRDDRMATPLGGDRRLMIGTTFGGRALTLVIEPTLEPTDWLVVSGWNSANHERRMLKR